MESETGRKAFWRVSESENRDRWREIGVIAVVCCAHVVQKALTDIYTKMTYINKNECLKTVNGKWCVNRRAKSTGQQAKYSLLHLSFCLSSVFFYFRTVILLVCMWFLANAPKKIPLLILSPVGPFIDSLHRKFIFFDMTFPFISTEKETLFWNWERRQPFGDFRHFICHSWPFSYLKRKHRFTFTNSNIHGC